MKQAMSTMHIGEVTICYGMTETSPVSTQTGPDDSVDKRVGTVGRVHPHVEVKIVDPITTRTVRRDTPGELLTRGYSVMIGYWNDRDRTGEVIDDQRWMHTGDLATMDSDGYVSIVGRIKDMIIRGGENVYPREIEEFLYTHPDISDVQVIGVPDARFGEEIMAWVKVRPGGELTVDDVRAFCRGRIAHFKVPRYVRFADDFPMTVTGKVQKFRMREIAIAELGIEMAGTDPA
jgi:fatty-acyl-CoA synthase